MIFKRKEGGGLCENGLGCCGKANRGQGRRGREVGEGCLSQRETDAVHSQTQFLKIKGKTYVGMRCLAGLVNWVNQRRHLIARLW